MKDKKILLLLSILSFALFFPVAADEAESEMTKKREAMVETRIKPKGIENQRVIEAMRTVPRHLFIPDYVRGKAYEDIPLPLGQGYFDPSPSLIAKIADAISPSTSDTVFVVGIGSGYLVAVLSRLAGEVATTDVNQVFVYQAMTVFETLKINNIQARLRDGSLGWEPYRLFDYIVINGAVNHIPQALLDSLKIGGKLVVPLGNPFGIQNLVVITKTETGLNLSSIGDVIFPPLKGKALDQSDKNEYPYPHEEHRDNSVARFYPAL